MSDENKLNNDTGSLDTNIDNSVNTAQNSDAAVVNDAPVVNQEVPVVSNEVINIPVENNNEVISTVNETPVATQEAPVVSNEVINIPVENNNEVISTVNETPVATQETPVVDNEVVSNPTVVQGVNVDTNMNSSQPTQNNVNSSNVVPGQEQKKKTPVGLIVGIAAGVVVLIVVILLLVLKPFGGGGGGALLSGPKGVVEKYVNNLITKGYGDNFALVSIPENHFVETSDYIEYIQKKSDYQGLDGFEIKTIQELSLEETKGMYNVVLSNESEMVKNISINVENVNSWKVIEDSLFIKDWSIIVPKGTKVTIGSKEVPQTLLVDDATSTNTIKYTIPAITSTKKSIVLNNPLQTMTVEETPLSANSGKKYEMVLNNQELVDKAYTYIKDTWNQMYTANVGKENVSDIASKYFDSSVDINNVDVYYNQSLGKIASNAEKDFKILEVIGREEYPNYVLTDELIQLNFGYKLSWIYAPTYSSRESQKEMTRYSKIILKYDGSSFKIYDVLDTKLFSYANYFTKEY